MTADALRSFGLVSILEQNWVSSGFFKEKALWQDCGRNSGDIIRAYSTSHKTVSPVPDDRADSFDFLPCFFCTQSKPSCLGQQVIDAGRATIIAHGQRKISTLNADKRCRHKIIGWREAPAFLPTQQSVIARMVVVVGDCGVEDHSAEQLGAIRFGLYRPPPQIVRQKGI